MSYRTNTLPRAVSWDSAAMRALRADPRVVDVEAEGMDDGRFMVWLYPEHAFDEGYGPATCKAFSSATRALAWLRTHKRIALARGRSA